MVIPALALAIPVSRLPFSCLWNIIQSFNADAFVGQFKAIESNLGSASRRSVFPSANRCSHGVVRCGQAVTSSSSIRFVNATQRGNRGGLFSIFGPDPLAEPFPECQSNALFLWQAVHHEKSSGKTSLSKQLAIKKKCVKPKK